MGRFFLVYATPLIAVFLFRYLGKKLWSSNDDWMAVELNLQRTREKWGRMEKILGRWGADKRILGRLYTALVQVVILFGSETWVLTSRLEKSLKGFHHREARRMAGVGPNSQWDGTWVYPPIGAELEMVGLEEIGVYISRHQKTVAEYIATHTIMELCLVEECAYPGDGGITPPCISRR